MEDVDVLGILRRSAELAPDPFAESNGQDNERLTVETWRQFEQKAQDHVPVLVDGLWPEAAFGFIAAPPKKGKTWLALALAISVATGKPFLGHFAIPEPRPVLYVALEGHRAGLRARVGAVAHGLELDPDSADLDNLHWLYKPAGINLSDPGWAAPLEEAAGQIEAALVIVDVLRASARIKENEQDSFSNLRRNLQPITDQGRSLAMLHHFGKLTETQKERDPGERMSGSGAMFGALDVAIYITGSEDGARKLRLEFDTRDIAAPERLNIQLEGHGTGENAGYTYTDQAAFRVLTDEEIAADDLTAPPVEVRAWLEQQPDHTATTAELSYAFGCHDNTILRRIPTYQRVGITVTTRRGRPTTYTVSSPTLSPPHQPNIEPLWAEGQEQSHFSPPPPRPTLERGDPLKSPDLQGKPQPTSPTSLRDHSVRGGTPYPGLETDGDDALFATVPEDAGPPDDEEEWT